MAWYAYCLTEQQLNNGARMRRPFILEGLQGVAGAPVLSYPNGEFAVIVSEYARAEELDKKAFLDRCRDSLLAPCHSLLRGGIPHVLIFVQVGQILNGPDSQHVGHTWDSHQCRSWARGR